MPTQTGSIDLSASNSVKLQADAQYSALSDNLSENYYTKSEFSVAPGEISSTIEERTEQSARPNLSPYFSSTFGDTSYWTGSTTPYRSSELGDIGTKLADGWMHVDMDNSARSGTAYLNTFILPQAWVKNSTEYTFLVEVRNLTIASGTYVQFMPAQGGESSQTGVEAYVNATEDGSYHLRSTTKENATSVSSFANFSRGYVAVIAGTNASFDYRLSVYEGEYDGPYKPYVDQSLLSRVSSAETSITQNAEAISLTATKVYQSAQPNLTPWFSVGSPREIGSYWKYAGGNGGSAIQFTETGDGWCRMVLDNTSGSGVRRYDYDTVAAEGIECGKDYTLLFEFRNIREGVGNAQVYAVQAGTYGMQFWGNSAQKVLQGTSLDCAVRLDKTLEQTGNQQAVLCDDGVYRKRVVRKSEASDSPYWTRSDDKRCVRLVTYCAAGASFDAEMRFSIYPGEYDGPYKPYSGKQLFASQAELKVANDAISARVEKDGVIGAINLSSEEAAINANRINLVGAVTIGDLTQEAQDATLNSNVSVGGRNILPDTATWGDRLWLDKSGATVSGDVLSYKASTLANSMVGVPVTPGGQYVLGFDAYADAELDFGDTGNMMFLLDYSSASEYHRVQYEWLGAGLVLGTDWKRYELPFTVPTTSTITHLFLRLRNKSTSASLSTTYHLRHLKLESGNRATDWTEAPEDVDAAIAGVSVGGRNLLWKTGSLPADWITSYNTATGGQSDPFGGTNAVLITPSKSTHYYVYRWAAHGMPKHPANGRGGGEFTFSVWLKAADSSANSSANVGLSIRSANSGKHMEEFTVPNTWTHVEMTGTIANGITNSDVVWLGQTSTDAFYMSYPKLEMGNRATDWTPAPEDVVSATTYVTEIGGGGIKVHPNGNTQDYAAITSDGMEVYSGGESVAEFGSTARIGDAGSSHVNITEDGLSMFLDRDEQGVPEVLRLYSTNGDDVFPGQYTSGIQFSPHRQNVKQFISAGETDPYNTMAIVSSASGTSRIAISSNATGYSSTIELWAPRIMSDMTLASAIVFMCDRIVMPHDTDVDTIASIITNVQSGVTVSEARYVRRGQTAMLRVVVTATSAQSGTWLVGTVVDGKRPFMQTFGSATNASFAGRIDAGGSLYAIGSLAANAGLTLTFTYVVQD